MRNGMDLGAALTDIGSRVEWPQAPTALADRVARKLEGQMPARPAIFRRALPAAGALAVLVGVLLTFSPATRDAVADFLGIGGVRIERVAPDDLPTPRVGEGFGFGTRVTLREAEDSVDFDILEPTLPALGPPDDVYVSALRPPGGLIALVYGARPGFEPDPISDVSVLITEFRATLETGVDFFKKLAVSGTQIRRVEVNGNEGYWLSGDAHSFFYRDSSGTVLQESLRLVGKVLLWEQDGITFRIETTGNLQGAKQIAAGLR